MRFLLENILAQVRAVGANVDIAWTPTHGALVAYCFVFTYPREWNREPANRGLDPAKEAVKL